MPRLCATAAGVGDDQAALPNVLTYFSACTNAGSEAINFVIQMLEKRAFGYLSFPSVKTAVLFHCDGPALHPPP